MKRSNLMLSAAVGILSYPLAAFAQTTLTASQAQTLFQSCQQIAPKVNSVVRTGKGTKMWCGIVDREGQLLLEEATDTGGTPSKPNGSDAWRGSIEIAIAKAYTALAFSSNDQALDSRTIGFLARTDDGLTGSVGSDTGPAPLFGIGDTNPFRSVVGSALGFDDKGGKFHHGIVTFAGGQPVYPSGGGALQGAVGVSGDGVDEDDTVAICSIEAAGFACLPSGGCPTPPHTCP
jgi:uncharacterized protein GlcG (DUF336 family)